MIALVKINFVVFLAVFIVVAEVVCEVGLGITPEHKNVQLKAPLNNSEGSQISLGHSKETTPFNQTQDGRLINVSHPLIGKYSNVDLAKSMSSSGHENTIPNYSEKTNISLLMEGGGKETLDHVSAASPENQNSESEKHGDGHASGSKGRKGVPQISSVVPRKGVPEDFGNKSALPDNTEHLPPNSLNEPTQTYKTPPHVSVHNRKPEYVSDKEDVDDFDKYSIIKTSTTGEDYVIIGIVIVIGIWFSVFGGLIFYRRAGEYWDRRHYRRMDFLVEGMYND